MNPETPSAGPAANALDLENLRVLLAQAPNHVAPRPSKTFFSLGGKGHWENPASDVLAFFLNPAEEHGFGPLFLRAFFNCMEVDIGPLNLEAGISSVDREEWLDEGRIDLVVRAPGWVLAIENKIHHWAANNFASYAQSILKAAGRPVHLALLAPERTEVGHGWQPITYRDFCTALSDTFGQTFPGLPESTLKWQIFAREFVNHLQTLLYPIAMPPDTSQLEFAEQHLIEIETLKTLSANYTKFLLGELQERLNRELPEHPPFEFGDHGWGLVCDHLFEGWRLVMFTPAHGHGGNPQRKFLASVYLNAKAGEVRRQRAASRLTEFKIVPEGRGHYWQSFYEDRESAIEGLCKIARAVFGPELA